MTGGLAALGAALVWAMTGLLLKPLSARLHPLFLNNVRCIATGLVIAVFLFAADGFTNLSRIPFISGAIIVIGTFIAVGIGESFFVLSLRYIDLSRAYPIALCGYPVVTLFISLIFLKEEISELALLGTIVILLGLYLTAFPRGAMLVRFSVTSSRERAGLLFLLLCVLSYGLGTVLIKHSIEGLDLVLVNLLRFSGAAILLIPLSFPQWIGYVRKKSDWRSLGLAAVSGVLSFGLGGMLFLLALDSIGAAMTSVLTSTSPLFLLPMSIFFLKEKVTARLVAGVILSISGICLIFIPRLIS